MDKFKIGQSDLEVANINLGGNVFGWTLDEQQSFEILDAFVDAGYNFLDTADIYSWWIGKLGVSETIIGNWMKRRNNRDKIILATKVGGQTSMETTPNVSKSYILKTVDESLQRLKTDYIDLYYSHFDDNSTPVEETLAAYDEIIKAGKVRYIAASNISPERLKASFHAAETYNLPRYQALQPHYNLIERKGYETNYAPIVDEYELSVMPYYALASGFLTGKYRSENDLGKSVRGGGLAKYVNENGLALLNVLDQVAEKHKVALSTVSLAWLMHQKNVLAPIVSATGNSQLDEILMAPKLNSEDFQRLNQVSNFEVIA